jgi:replicative DNA helicase
MIDKPLPQSIDAEKGLLGSILLEPDKVLDECIQKQVNGLHFHHPVHQQIYGTLIEMRDTGKPIDQVSLTQCLEDRNILAQVGGGAAVTELFLFVPSASNFKYYIQVLRDKHIFREAIAIARQIEDASFEGTNIQDIVENGFIRIAGLLEITDDEVKTMKKLALRAIDRLERRIQGEEFTGIMTGINSLDRALQGMQPGQMITIAAYHKVGKSALAANIALHNALQKIPVAMFSLEMNADEISDRLMSAQSKVDLTKLSNGISEYDCNALVAACHELSETTLFIRDDSNLSPARFRAAARKLKKQHAVQLIILDYLQLMDPTSAKESRERQVAEFSRSVKNAATELRIPIIVLSQLNASGESRESRAIEQDSNVILKLHEDDNGGHYIDVTGRACARNRVAIEFNKSIMRFSEL